MTELALSEAVPLAHALLDRLALESGVRVLFIKGPTAVAQRLRAPRESLDVDALVDPARRDHLAERLAELGWVDEHPYTSPTVLPMHSTTHRHHRWPNELDLHDRFPGFFADAQDVFERLWERRKTVNVAAHDIACPDPAGQALVLALHTLRDPHDARKAHELSSLVERVSATASADSLRDLAELARELGAADTAAPFLDRVGAPAVGRGSTDPADLRAWELRTQPDTTTSVSWVHELRQLPWRRRPRYLWYAAFLSDVELRLAEPNLPPGRTPLLKARGRRLRRGLRSLPRAARAVRIVEAKAAQEAALARGEVITETRWKSVRLPTRLATALTSGLGVADRAILLKRGVVIRTFPDFDDQGLEMANALNDAGIGPIAWLVKGSDEPAEHVRRRLPSGVRLVGAGTFRGVGTYLSARVVVHTHGLYGIPPRSRRKLFVNVWHGWGTKALPDRPPVAASQSDIVTVCSTSGRAAVAEAWRLDDDAVRITGLPRNDCLIRSSRSPRPDVLRRLVPNDVPLVAWLPTYRQSTIGELRTDGIRFDNDFQLPRCRRSQVGAVARAAGVQIILKAHPMAELHEPGTGDGVLVWDQVTLDGVGLSLYELMGCADVLISDYSSAWVDYLLLDRPLIFTMADSEEYAATRGHYSESGALTGRPGPVVDSIEALQTALSDALTGDTWSEARRVARSEFHDLLDSHSAERVVALIAENVKGRS